MKKALSIIAAFMLFGAFTPQAWAYDFWATAPSGQTLYYSIRTDGTSVSVVWPNSSATAASETWTGYTKPTGGLIIPNSVTNGGVTYTVKGIGTAFYQCTELTSVVVADSVLWIAVNAFSGCTGLTSVTIGNSVASIGDRVFYNCSNLTSVTIPNSVTTIGDYAFYGCSGLTTPNTYW